MPVVEKAIETAALMLGSDRSRGYCLEMICADYLARANLDKGDPESLLLQAHARRAQGGFPRRLEREGLMTFDWTEAISLGARSEGRTRLYGRRCCVVMAGVVSRAARW
jgi:hypothetical protein